MSNPHRYYPSPEDRALFHKLVATVRRDLARFQQAGEALDTYYSPEAVRRRKRAEYEAEAKAFSGSISEAAKHPAIGPYREPNVSLAVRFNCAWRDTFFVTSNEPGLPYFVLEYKPEDWRYRTALFLLGEADQVEVAERRVLMGWLMLDAGRGQVKPRITVFQSNATRFTKEGLASVTETGDSAKHAEQDGQITLPEEGFWPPYEAGWIELAREALAFLEARPTGTEPGPEPRKRERAGYETELSANPEAVVLATEADDAVYAGLERMSAEFKAGTRCPPGEAAVDVAAERLAMVDALHGVGGAPQKTPGELVSAAAKSLVETARAWLGEGGDWRLFQVQTRLTLLVQASAPVDPALNTLLVDVEAKMKTAIKSYRRAVKWSLKVQHTPASADLRQHGVYGMSKLLDKDLASRWDNELMDDPCHEWGFKSFLACEKFEADQQRDERHGELTHQMAELLLALGSRPIVVEGADAGANTDGKGQGKSESRLGMRQADVKKQATAIVKAEGWQPIKPLAKRIGCNPRTLYKAIEISRYLKARRAVHEADKEAKRKPREAGTGGRQPEPVSDGDELDRLIAEQEADDARDRRRAKPRRDAAG